MSVRVMAQVWDTDLPPHLKLVLLSYADHANDDGTSVYPGEARMVEKTSYSAGTIRRNTKTLIEDGYLIQTKRGHRGQRAEYQVDLSRLKGAHNDTLSKGAHIEPERRASEVERRASDTVKARTGDTPIHHDSSDPSENHQLAETAKRKGKPNVVWDFLIDPRGFGMAAETPTQERRVGLLTREITAKLATLHLNNYIEKWVELLNRAATWPDHFPDATLTPDAFEKHFELLGSPPLKRSASETIRQQTRDAIEVLTRSTHDS